MGRRTTRAVDLVLVGVLAVLLGQIEPATAQPRTPSASQPVYDYTGAIRETVWVDTGLDLDRDGAHDRVAADIIRPRELASSGRVPVIMDASPYYRCCGRGNESQVKKYDSAGKPTDFPLFYDNYFVPRGYAVVEVDLAGTNRSDGCTDVGGTSDVTSAKAVVDWLNGRAGGYSARTGGSAVTAGWSTGAVGMIGKSWDGTIANGVAATGVDGLKTIVPISAISSWYDYYRADGATFPASPAGLARIDEDTTRQQACKPVNDGIAAGAQADGNYDAMWAQRDYVANAAKVRASVFVAHGLNDLNVRTINFGQWWTALPSGVQKKIWLSQTGHVDPFDYRRGAWVDTLHQWFDHYLLGVDNGIDRTPQADIERTPDQWSTDPAWPLPGAPSTVALGTGATNGLGTLGGPPPATGTRESFTDNPSQGESDWTANPDRVSSARVVFSTAPLAANARVSGTPAITVTATSSTTAARLSAVLVDLGTTTTRDFQSSGEGVRNLTTRSCWGSSTTADSGCYLDTAAVPLNTGALVFSRGWADLGHYASLTERRTLSPGTRYRITFDLASTDHVVPKGHRLALIVAGTDSDAITRVTGTPTVAVDLAGSSLRLPLTGSLSG